MTTATMLICPVGHPSGPGQSFCPLCGRDNIAVEAPPEPEPVVAEVPMQAPPVEASPFAELASPPPPPPAPPVEAVAEPVVEAPAPVEPGPAPHYAPNKTHFWDGFQWLPGHLGPQ